MLHLVYTLTCYKVASLNLPVTDLNETTTLYCNLKAGRSKNILRLQLYNNVIIKNI